jgi:hypothetical protein
MVGLNIAIPMTADLGIFSGIYIRTFAGVDTSQHYTKLLKAFRKPSQDANAAGPTRCACNWNEGISKRQIEVVRSIYGF